MKLFSKRTAGFVFTVLLLQGCVESSEQGARSDKEITKVQDDIDRSTLVNISGKIFSVPSPVETAMLIEAAGAEYDGSLLNSTQNVGNYASVVDKSLAMGVYGANLAYTAIFEKNQESLSYLNALEKLSSALDLTNAVDPALIKRFSQNLGNRDSMLVLSGQFFRSSDFYLKENDRDDVSALILAGGWIEGMYLAYNSTEGNETLKQRIAEQKQTLSDIIELLRNQEENDSIAALISKLTDLKASYEGVTSTYEYRQPETDVKRKLTVLKSKSSHKITDDQMNEIGNQVEALRNHIVG
jgi:hypothetical protein